MDNQTRRILLERVKASGFPGSILDVFQNPAILDEYVAQQQQQQQPIVAQTPQEQEQGLGPAHAAGNFNQSMIFPNVQPGQSFNTMETKVPINIDKVDDQGNLVESYKAVPPGIQNFPTGPNRGMVIESPAEGYQTGGVRKYQTAGFDVERIMADMQYPGYTAPTVDIVDYKSDKQRKKEREELERSARILPSGAINSTFGPLDAAVGVAAGIPGLLVRGLQAGVPAVANALNAPAVVGSTTLPGITVGNVLGAAGAGYSTQQILDPSSELRTNPNAENILTTGLGFIGLPYKSAALSFADDLGQAGKYLTTQTPLKNAYKYNPWAFEPNPEAYYRMIGKEGYADALESGVIRPPQTSRIFDQGSQKYIDVPYPAYEEAYYNAQFPLDKRWYPQNKITINPKTGKPRRSSTSGYEGPYMTEVTGNSHLFENAENVAAYTGPNASQTVTYSKEFIPINTPGVKFYKEDWLRGYKQVPKPKTLPRSKTSYSIVRDSEGKIQFLDNETYRDALVTGKSNIVNYLSDPRYKAVVEGNQELANRLNMNRALPIQKEMGNAGLHDARVAKINQPITILDPRSLETKIIQGTNEGVQAQYSRNLDGSGFLTIPRVYDKTKTIKNVEHEALHHVYPNLGEGLPSFTPLEARKAKAVFKDNAALRKIEEENNIPFWYLDDVDELVPNSFDLANDLGIAKFQKYPGVESFKKMLESYTGGKKFIKDALKLDTPRDYKRAWDMLSGVRLGIIPAALTTGAAAATGQDTPQQKTGGVRTYLKGGLKNRVLYNKAKYKR